MSWDEQSAFFSLVIQKDLDRLEEQADRNIMKFDNTMQSPAPGGLDRQQAEHEPAACSGSQDGHQYPGLY